MYNNWYVKRTWKAYTDKVFDHPFCYNCPMTYPIGFLADGFRCYVLGIDMDIAAKPTCSKTDWIKHLMEVL